MLPIDHALSGPQLHFSIKIEKTFFVHYCPFFPISVKLAKYINLLIDKIKLYVRSVIISGKFKNRLIDDFSKKYATI